MDYRIVYDIATSFPDVWFPASGLLLLALGATMLHSVRTFVPAGSTVRSGWFGPYAFLGFAVLWTAGVSFGVGSEWLSARRALTSGDVYLVEGVVESYVPATVENRRSESFVVDGYAFAYRAHVIGARFHETASEGGPIRAGQHVRIHARRDAILRLEIARSDLRESASTESLRTLQWMLLPVVAVAGFALVVFVISVVGGWRGLAERFGADALIPGDVHLGVSAYLGVIGSYRNLLIVSIGRDAFAMRPVLPFGAFHRPLVIPFAAITTVKETTRFLVGLISFGIADTDRTIEFRHDDVGTALRDAYARWRRDEVRGAQR